MRSYPDPICPGVRMQSVRLTSRRSRQINDCLAKLFQFVKARVKTSSGEPLGNSYFRSFHCRGSMGGIWSGPLPRFTDKLNEFGRMAHATGTPRLSSPVMSPSRVIPNRLRRGLKISSVWAGLTRLSWSVEIGASNEPSRSRLQLSSISTGSVNPTASRQFT